MQQSRSLIYPENQAKELLRGYIPMRKRRDALAQEIEDHYSRAYSCTVRLNPYRSSGGGAAYDRMAEDICRAEDWEMGEKSLRKRKGGGDGGVPGSGADGYGLVA